MPDNMPSPSLLALGAAVLFGVSVHLARLALRHLDSFTAARLTIAVTFVFFLLPLPFTTRLEDFTSPGLLVFVVVGLFQPSLSMTLSFAATRQLGATVSATVSSVSPLFALTGAVLLLGESVTAPVLVGTLGVVLGVVVISLRGKSPRRWPLSALMLPIATAAIRGAGNLGTRYGMGLLPNVLLAGATAYGVSLLVAYALQKFALAPLPFHQRLTWHKAASAVPAGICIGCAMLLMILALREGQVVVVAPIIGSFPLFTLLLTVLWFREEALGWRVIAGMLLILPSVAVIGLTR